MLNYLSCLFLVLLLRIIWHVNGGLIGFIIQQACYLVMMFFWSLLFLFGIGFCFIFISLLVWQFVDVLSIVRIIGFLLYSVSRSLFALILRWCSFLILVATLVISPVSFSISSLIWLVAFWFHLSLYQKPSDLRYFFLAQRSERLPKLWGIILLHRYWKIIESNAVFIKEFSVAKIKKSPPMLNNIGWGFYFLQVLLSFGFLL